MQNDYKNFAKRTAVKSPLFFDCLKAFFVGGAVCVLGQGLYDLYRFFGVGEGSAGTVVSVSLIFIAVLLTGFGVFDDCAKFAGAGTLVPITGFANAVASQAIDSRTEGYILGVGAKIFTVAGPVILYASLSGAVYGVILWCISLFNGS